MQICLMLNWGLSHTKHQQDWNLTDIHEGGTMTVFLCDTTHSPPHTDQWIFHVSQADEEHLDRSDQNQTGLHHWLRNAHFLSLFSCSNSLTANRSDLSWRRHQFIYSQQVDSDDHCSSTFRLSILVTCHKIRWCLRVRDISACLPTAEWTYGMCIYGQMLTGAHMFCH